MTNRTTIERKSERELVVTRIFDGPARLVFEAWTKPELMTLWWAPKSTGVPLLSCEMDVRVGGLLFGLSSVTTPRPRDSGGPAVPQGRPVSPAPDTAVSRSSTKDRWPDDAITRSSGCDVAQGSQGRGERTPTAKQVGCE